MIEVGIAQAQAQFTKLLNKSVTIVDKRLHLKKAVLLPYDEYVKLIEQCTRKEDLQSGSFDQYVGLLDEEFMTDDARYNEIVQ